jgi:hypothetical protein
VPYQTLAEGGSVNSIVLSIWAAALLLYGAFWLWYAGIPRPLSAAEIDAHLAIVAGSKLPIGPE